jgi:hypothetical protein
MRANIALYGGMDLYLAKGGIEGGLNFTASINLNDPDNDGKLRVMEAIAGGSGSVEYTGGRNVDADDQAAHDQPCDHDRIAGRFVHVAGPVGRGRRRHRRGLQRW